MNYKTVARILIVISASFDCAVFYFAYVDFNIVFVLLSLILCTFFLTASLGFYLIHLKKRLDKLEGVT